MKRLEETAEIAEAERKRRFTWAGIWIAVMILSFTVLCGIASSPETYKKPIRSLDEKRNTVMSLIATSTAVSGAITFIPDDAGTPIAEQLAELSSDFVIVLSAIFLEKYLLTVTGWIFFKWLVPILCLLIVIRMFVKDRMKIFLTEKAASIVMKLGVICIGLWASVLISIGISVLIEQTYETSINATIEAAQNTTKELEEEADAEKAEKGFIGKMIFKVTDIADDVVSGTAGMVDKLQNALNNLIESFAIFIVTTLIIPLGVVMVQMLLIKRLFGMDFIPTLQMGYRKLHVKRRR